MPLLTYRLLITTKTGPPQVVKRYLLQANGTVYVEATDITGRIYWTLHTPTLEGLLQGLATVDDLVVLDTDTIP